LNLDSINLVQSFVIVAEELSFRRSAERLCMDRSALTRRIQKLEHLLGFPLLERTTREVSLTPAGRAFYETNAQLLQGYASAVESARQVAHGKTGILRVGYMAFAATELMPRAVAAFQIAHPHVAVKLHYIRTQGQKIALTNDEIDIGYMIGPFDHSEFHSAPLSQEKLYAVMPRGHRLAEKTTVAPTDLAGHDFVFGDMVEWEAYRWRITEMFSGEGVPLNIALEAPDTLALAGLVAAGLGVTVCPESLIGLFGGTMEARVISHPNFRIQTILVWRRNKRTTPLRNFVEVTKGLSASAP
jgi:DNA-binding transcriptional LysR family regulator